MDDSYVIMPLTNHTNLLPNNRCQKPIGVDMKANFVLSMRCALLPIICVHYKYVSLLKAPSDWFNKEQDGQ